MNQNSNKKSSGSTGISQNQKDQIIQKQYNKVIANQKRPLSATIKNSIHKQITTSVTKEINNQNKLINQIIHYVQVTSHNELTHAFIRPYQLAIPFLVLQA
ncbi:hypothetical protein [Lentilactobacillus sp. SPB1-3]|uniref:Uncharacterized protein n=1 Tax=Lentilactobacillus terminaliae TaxID=3003483 RepID=A0ACD5DH07_9LACO|nr:hypothetical protein [Lentilactobacillus sp. SPB1-3]MCZ0977347.1 hypothetical protein [Lentilactobacillus sp. SPB1-3]